MSKYKDKMNKEKEKCEKLIKKVYGDTFYFVHATYSLEQILKDGVIKMGSESPNTGYAMPVDKLSYVYANIHFDDNDYKNVTNTFFKPYHLILHPKLLSDMKIAFNKYWEIYPNRDSIMFNKNDTTKERFKKLKEVKEIVLNPEKREFIRPYETSHEFLFPKNIKITDYLIGIIFGRDLENKKIDKMLKDKKFSHIKLFNEKIIGKQKYPLLTDILC